MGAGVSSPDEDDEDNEDGSYSIIWRRRRKALGCE